MANDYERGVRDGKRQMAAEAAGLLKRCEKVIASVTTAGCKRDYPNLWSIRNAVLSDVRRRLADIEALAPREPLQRSEALALRLVKHANRLRRLLPLEDGDLVKDLECAASMLAAPREGGEK